MQRKSVKCNQSVTTQYFNLSSNFGPLRHGNQTAVEITADSNLPNREVQNAAALYDASEKRDGRGSNQNIEYQCGI